LLVLGAFFGVGRMSTAYETKQLWTSIVEPWDCRREWLQARNRGIGASEVAAIFGCGYESASPVTVWAEKTGQAAQEFDEATLKRLNRGKRLEPYIAMEFSEETSLATVDPGEFTIFRSSEYDWLFATLDRWCIHPEHGPIPVELKAVNGRFRSDWDEELEPPLKYNVQCQTQMAVTGASHCYLVGLIGGDELSIRLIERNDRFIEAMLSKLAKFWLHVLNKTMPPVDESEATKAVLGLIYPHDQGTEVSLPEEFRELDLRLATAKEAAKALDKEITGIENQIRAAIGEATKGVLPGGGGFTWKDQSRKSIDAEMLRATYPEVAVECEKCSTFRVLKRSSK
jgi:putative phage-type endonuclease